MPNKIRPIAIYLPQFHPIPENDKWWGKGFTEWRNVVRAKPLFKGHYQPHLPTDLGFYDLRVPEVREQQAQLAKEHGIYGFCYYHYWFNGRRVLEHPFEEVLNLGKPDFPFMLCWANENWSRRWDGNDKDVLLAQQHSDYDDERHIGHLIEYFKDRRYIRVNGKPIIIIYKKLLLSNPKKTTEIWRRVASQQGMELFICHMVFSYEKDKDKHDGFDAVIDFEPFGIRREGCIMREIGKRREKTTIVNIVSKILLKSRLFKTLANRKFLYNVIEYDYLFKNLKSLSSFKVKIFPTIVPGWDNTARKMSDATLILEDASPDKFERWLQQIIADFEPYEDDENFVFINAWNEWAEGNHLEPDIKWGHSFLKAVKKAIVG